MSDKTDKGAGAGPNAGQGAGHVPGRQVSGQKKGSERELAVRLKNARSHKASSQQWLQRQLNDPYVVRAKREGYRSRAAYKFLEIDNKYKLLRPGQRIVDLGAAPGGWSQIAAARVGTADGGRGKVVGIDLLEMEPIPGVELAVMDFNDNDAPERLKAMLGGPADGVISDMAANTTGHKKTDHLRIIALAELAVEFAAEVLAPGGFFLCKLFQGGDTVEIVNRLKKDFAVVRHVKPDASRAGSAELYVLATGFRGV
jgi:23S rRNA (uridine2552-2'-O)-methyltransferase